MLIHTDTSYKNEKFDSDGTSQLALRTKTVIQKTKHKSAPNKSISKKRKAKHVQHQSGHIIILSFVLPMHKKLASIVLHEFT